MEKILHNKNKPKLSMLPLFFVVFLSLVGVGVVIPIIAMLFLDKTGGVLPFSTPENIRTIYLGLLIAVYPFVQFFSAPIIGALSDRYGRKKLLITSLIGTTIGYLVFGAGILTKNIFLLFLGRIIDGITGGNIVVAYSSIADVSDQKSKAKNFGIVGMAFGFGFIIGPYLGGVLASPDTVSWFNYATPFWFVALLSALNIFMVIFMFKETLSSPIKTKISALTGMKNIKKAFSMTHLRTVFLVMFLATLGFNFYTQFNQVFLFEKFHFTETDIGNFYAYQGIWIAITQGLINRFFSSKFPPRKIIPITLFGLAITLCIMILPSKAYLLFFIAPFIAIFWGLTYPNALAIISNLSKKDSQGEAMGMNQSFQALAMTIPPIISGFIVSVNLYLPLIVSSSVVLCSWLCFMFFFDHKKEPLFEEE